MSFAIAIQFYSEDRARAMRLSRFIADLEPTFRDDATIVFVNRFDCEPVDGETLAYVGKKFQCAALETTTQWTGWPAGPNGMALDVLRESKEHPVSWGFSGDILLLLEPDCVPLAKEWINALILEWHICLHALEDDIWVCGAWRDSGSAYGHINGCCMVRPDLARLIDLSAFNPHLAWDCALAPQLKDYWKRTGLIKNCFQSRNATEKDLTTPDEGTKPPVLIHGYKDDSAWDWAQKLIL